MNVAFLMRWSFWQCGELGPLVCVFVQASGCRRSCFGHAQSSAIRVNNVVANLRLGLNQSKALLADAVVQLLFAHVGCALCSESGPATKAEAPVRCNSSRLCSFVSLHPGPARFPACPRWGGWPSAFPFTTSAREPQLTKQACRRLINVPRGRLAVLRQAPEPCTKPHFESLSEPSPVYCRLWHLASHVKISSAGQGCLFHSAAC